MTNNPLNLHFELHPTQAAVVDCLSTETLFGGAASGGKSHLARVLSILWALEIPGINIYIFRRLFEDLVKNHLEGANGFRAMLASWCNTKHPKSPLIGSKLCEIVKGEIRFWNGSKIFLCHLQHQKDLTKYYGPEFHVLILEEATQFSEFMIRFLRSRMRIPKSLKIPDKYLKPRSEWRIPNEPDYYFPRALYTSNPGGIGHGYIKKAFLSHEPYTLHKADTRDGGHVRCFIPAKVDDNPSVNREQVKEGLSGLPPVLVDAMLNGNWDAVIGAYFPEIDPLVHLIPPFSIPPHWTKFMSMDWGSCGDADPFAIGWFAVSDGSIPKYPRGQKICYRMWTGHKLPKTTVSEVARGIQLREREDGRISDRVAGGDIQQTRGTGPSILEMFSNYHINFRRADMRRQPGWQQVREELVGIEGVPMLVFFDSYGDEVETIQNLQHDINDQNDCAQGDDHVAEMVRYGVMSRPWVTTLDKPQDPWVNYQNPSLDQMWALRDQLISKSR